MDGVRRSNDCGGENPYSDSSDVVELNPPNPHSDPVHASSNPTRLDIMCQIFRSVARRCATALYYLYSLVMCWTYTSICYSICFGLRVAYYVLLTILVIAVLPVMIVKDILAAPFWLDILPYFYSAQDFLNNNTEWIISACASFFAKLVLECMLSGVLGSFYQLHGEESGTCCSNTGPIEWKLILRKPSLCRFFWTGSWRPGGKYEFAWLQ